MKSLYVDCFAGISGNMLLGALLDMGLPEKVLRAELNKLPLSEYELVIDRVNKRGISAYYVDVKLKYPKDKHHQYSLADIIALIDNSALTPTVKDSSKKVFHKLFEAEAKVHGASIAESHFQGAWAVDAIIDIIGTAVGFHYFGVEKVAVSKIRVGSGFTKCSYGNMPIPTPLTAELLRGITYYEGDIAREMTTPRGAALISVFGAEFGEKPEGFISEYIGYGAGTWDLEIPNVLRLHRGYIKNTDKNNIIVVETNIDDLNTQLYPYVMDKLLEAGALDVWVQSVLMKKGRPGYVLSVLTQEDKLTKITEVILSETSSIGIRYYKAERKIAERNWEKVKTVYGEASVKVCRYQGRVSNVCPEYEDLKKLAIEKSVPLKKVQQAVWAAANNLYEEE